MNVSFSVPAYPQFRPGLVGDEYRKHDAYLKRFENYACTSLKLQMEATLTAAEKFAAGDGRAVMELERTRLKQITDNLASVAAGVVERATVAVDSEMSMATRAIEVNVRKLVSDSVAEVKAAVDEMSAERVDSCCGFVDEDLESVSEKTLANRARRHARAELKRKRKAAAGRATGPKVTGVGIDECDVPEWRRRDARATIHKGVFSECSDEIQRELRESRARMLVEKNKTALVEAEASRRKTEARMKAQVIEREVEAARLKMDVEHKKLLDAREAALPKGFAETVVSEGLASVFTVPSAMTSGSVSPNSSVSVEMVVKMENAIAKLTKKVSDVEATVAVKEEKIKNLEARIVDLNSKSARNAGSRGHFAGPAKPRRDANGFPIISEEEKKARMANGSGGIFSTGAFSRYD